LHKPTHKAKIAKEPPSKRTTPDHMNGQTKYRQEGRTDNSGFAKKRVQWFIERSPSYQLLCWVETLLIRNPLLRQAPKRYRAV